jgi:hypothetical protein
MCNFQTGKESGGEKPDDDSHTRPILGSIHGVSPPLIVRVILLTRFPSPL